MLVVEITTKYTAARKPAIATPTNRCTDRVLLILKKNTTILLSFLSVVCLFVLISHVVHATGI